jgi:hypothetical protein
MAGYARIDSIDALKNLRTSLTNFAKKISTALDEADFDIQQTLHWLQHDRYSYWKNELRVRADHLTKAKRELKRKEAFDKSVSGGHLSFIDEKKALAAAQRRFEEAEDKLNKIRRWIPLLEKEGNDCRASLQGLSALISVDLPNERAHIDQMIYALESYVNLEAPLPPSPQAVAAPDAATYTRPPENVQAAPDEENKEKKESASEDNNQKKKQKNEH